MKTSPVVRHEESRPPSESRVGRLLPTYHRNGRRKRRPFPFRPQRDDRVGPQSDVIQPPVATPCLDRAADGVDRLQARTGGVLDRPDGLLWRAELCDHFDLLFLCNGDHGYQDFPLMNTSTPGIVRRRLRNQKLMASRLHDPAAIVSWMGAVQAQDYAGAKWALALRSPSLTDAAIDIAFDEGRILRTHVMRPTWHFVSPADIRWMLALTSPRVHRISASYYRKVGLDDATFARSRRALERALRGGRHLTRRELASVFAHAGIDARGLRLGFLTMHAELEAVVCSGPRQGKQFTYALLEERVPPVPPLSRDEARAELCRRFFASHGPATIKDFVWWSGLTVRDARGGIDAIAPALAQENVDGLAYWCVPSRAPAAPPSPLVYLLPNYDELGIAYRDREVAPALPRPAPISAGSEGQHLLWIDGRFVGRWKRKPGSKRIVVEVQPFRRLMPAERRALEAEVARYGKFVELHAELLIVD
jgi:hypothetical protein